jgi:cytochrome c peroxidase
VLPKDIPRPELNAMMQGFARGLGVQCNYCHVAEGRGGRNDFASDEKPQKKVARVMMQMVEHDNDMIAKGVVGKAPADIVKVECATCHRGAAIPKVEMPPTAAGGAPGR